jgi:hypothetical protein
MLVIEGVPDHAVAYRLDWGLEQRLTARSKRAALMDHPDRVAKPLIDAARMLIAAGRVPGEMHVDGLGVIEVAPTAQELRFPGFSGFAMDEDHEARRIIRSAVSNAGKLLAPDSRYLLVLRWDAELGRMAEVLRRMLERRADKKPRLVGVLLVSASLKPPEWFARYTTTLVAPEAEASLARSRVLLALVEHFSS